MATPTSPVPVPTVSKTTPAEFADWLNHTNHRDRSYVLALHCALGTVLLVCALFNAYKLLLTWRFHNRPAVENWLARSARASRAWVRKYLTYFTIPTPYFFFTGGEVLLVTLYALTVIILAFSGAQESPMKPGTLLTLDGFSNRCSYIFVASLPWIVALSMKNNIISFLTGVPYERLQIYHRSLGRIGLLLVLAHTITKLSHNRKFIDLFRRWGMAAFLVCIALWFVSTRNIMNKGYQVFVHLHVILIITLAVCIWEHTTSPPGGEAESGRVHLYLEIAGGLWAAERLARIAKMIKINVSLRNRKTRSTRMTGMILSKNMMRLEIVKEGLQDWCPGQHVYLASPPWFKGLSMVFEAHPFTIASVPRELGPKRHKGTNGFEAGLVKGLSSSDIEMQHTHRQPIIGDAPGRAMSPSEDTTSKLVFYISARGGFTKRLYNRIQAGQPLHLLMYGPYSRPLSLCRGYETIVLFAGGAGVSWTLPLLMDLCRQAAQRRNVVKQIVWIWCVRNSESIPWITQPIASTLQLDGSIVSLDIRIYITQEHAHRRQPPREWTDVASGKQRAPWIVQGRPSIRSVVQGSIDNAAGRIWVGVCGPTSMSLTVRQHARELIDPITVYQGDYTRDITIHTESFGW